MRGETCDTKESKCCLATTVPLQRTYFDIYIFPRLALISAHAIPPVHAKGGLTVRQASFTFFRPQNLTAYPASSFANHFCGFGCSTDPILSTYSRPPELTPSSTSFCFPLSAFPSTSSLFLLLFKPPPPSPRRTSPPLPPQLLFLRLPLTPSYSLQFILPIYPPSVACCHTPRLTAALTPLH